MQPFLHDTDANGGGEGGERTAYSESNGPRVRNPEGFLWDFRQASAWLQTLVSSSNRDNYKSRRIVIRVK